jgi:hypothetical protein
MRQSEDEYARKLDRMNENAQQRPLLLERDTRHDAVRKLEQKIQRAMNLAQVNEQDLIRQQHN